MVYSDPWHAQARLSGGQAGAGWGGMLGGSGEVRPGAGEQLHIPNLCPPQTSGANGMPKKQAAQVGRPAMHSVGHSRAASKSLLARLDWCQRLAEPQSKRGCPC